jgi:predicted small lipoprotein YifL
LNRVGLAVAIAVVAVAIAACGRKPLALDKPSDIAAKSQGQAQSPPEGQNNNSLFPSAPGTPPPPAATSPVPPQQPKSFFLDPLIGK